ncbi:hypothetical protein KJI93_002877 [Salmonella enterica subsp. enterica serovar Enteritidis]|nr:hypothetical protein [Salmonella enterica subsp. enterica serovar Enteritidis]ELB6698437.1 hypothetical protein [Salmonella enterica]HCJ3481686.1 hypothetical protein [Salmonella enterica]HDL9312007.1 hypothetical protein [Salmonella enterica]
MTIQQWLFSFKGRIGRRDFWIWIGLWFAGMLAWMLLAGNWAMLPGMWQWVVGRFIPTLILVMMLIDLGAFVGVQGENKFGKATQDVKFKAEL